MTVQSSAQNLYPPPTSGTLNGPLDAKDTCWLSPAPSGFSVETHAFHTILKDGSWAVFRFAVSLPGIFLAPTTIQFSFKRFDPSTKTKTEKTVPLTCWKVDGPSASSTEFSLAHTGTPTTEETYSITGSVDGLSVDLQFVKPASCPGFKIGQGQDGGTTFFGLKSARKPDGFVLNRFLPVLQVTGTIVVGGDSFDADGEGAFVRSVQAMRPNLVARRWNFAFFAAPATSSDGKGRTRALLLEFETTDDYGVGGKGKGRDTVSVGAIVHDGALTLVTSAVNQKEPQDKVASNVCQSQDHDPSPDPLTSFSPPSSVVLRWAGASEKGGGPVSASIATDTPTAAIGQDGFVDRVDVFAKMPALVRKIVVSIASSQPFVYQHFRPAQLKIALGEGDATEERLIEGSLFTELSFIS